MLEQDAVNAIAMHMRLIATVMLYSASAVYIINALHSLLYPTVL